MVQNATIDEFFDFLNYFDQYMIINKRIEKMTCGGGHNPNFVVLFKNVTKMADLTWI